MRVVSIDDGYDDCETERSFPARIGAGIAVWVGRWRDCALERAPAGSAGMEQQPGVP